MRIAKTIARKIVFPVLLGLRFDRFFLSRSKNNCIIVNFHGVTNVVGYRFNNRHLDVIEFDKILTYLKRNYKIVSLKEIFEIHQSKRAPKQKMVAITFDDGYINNFSQALPVLKKHNIPATFYLISKGLVDDTYFVWPDIVDLIQRDVKENINLDVGNFKYPGFYCEELKISLVDFFKSCGSKREKYIAELYAKYPFYKEVASKQPQLIELVRGKEFSRYTNESLIEYGSHSHAHFNLEYLTKTECEFELNESKKIIKELTGKDPVSLAFPDGSYNKETLEVALKAGYKNLVAVSYKYNEANKNPNLLSRFTISNSTTFESNALRLAMGFKEFGF